MGRSAGRGARTLPWWAARVVLGWVSLLSGGLEGQTIAGRVVDALSGAGIASAAVVALEPLSEDSAAVLGRVLSDTEGRFSLVLPDVGEVLLTATVIGYRASAPTPVRVGSFAERVEVEIRLSQQAVELEGLSVVARGLELRHRRSVEGFRERHRTRRRVGDAKLVMTNEPIAQASGDVEILLHNMLVNPLECMVTYRDGIPLPKATLLPPVMFGTGRRRILRDDAPGMGSIVGVEFYRRQHDAPMELRDRRPPCLDPEHLLRDFSVLAYWTGRPDPVVDPSRIELRVYDEATGSPLDGRVFLEGSDGTLSLAGVVEAGVATIELPSDPEVTLVARAGGYFDSAPLVLTTEDREEGVAFVWLRHMDPSKRIDAVYAMREALRESGVKTSATRIPREMAVKVVDGAGNPLGAVQVWSDTIPIGVTDASGFFRTTFEEPVRTSIRLTRLGLAEMSTVIDFEQSAQGVLLQTTMRPEAIELEPITVTAVQPRFLADVDAIQATILRGAGRFVQREEIQARAYPRIGELARGQPGVEIRNGRPYSRRSPRCGPMAFFVDGVPMMGDISDYLRTSSTDVELVEVFVGGGGVPARYQMGTSRCGVVGIWTRRGGQVELSDLLDFKPWLNRSGGR